MRSVLLVFTILAVLGILVGAAFLATYEGEILRDPHPDDRDATLPPGAVQPEDIEELRFDLAVRGYRMAEVDGVLHRLRDELADRDTRIAELERALVEKPVASAPVDTPAAEPERTQEPVEVPVPPARPVASAPVDSPDAEAERTHEDTPSAPEAYEPLEPPAAAPAMISGPLTATTWFTEPAPSAHVDTPPTEPERTQEHRFSLPADDDAFSFPELTPPPPADSPSGEDPDRA